MYYANGQLSAHIFEHLTDQINKSCFLKIIFQLYKVSCIGIEFLYC
jgi:hypothetical protein